MQEKAVAIKKNYIIHDIFEAVHEELSNSNQKMVNNSQIAHNSKTEAVPVDSNVGECVMIHLENPQHKDIRAVWIALMRIIAANSDLVFEVEDFFLSRKENGTHTAYDDIFNSDVDRALVTRTMRICRVSAQQPSGGE